MKNLKYLFLTLLSAFAFVACTEDTREADWSGIQGNGVYFAMDSQTSYMLEENQSSLQIPVERTYSEGDLTVNVSLEDESGLFAADSKARFKNGEKVGKVEIVFNFSQIEAGVAYAMTLSILDKNQLSGYGISDLTFTVKYDPWKTVGTALWRDDLLTLVADVDCCETEVELQQSLTNKNLYRLVNVYNPEFIAEVFGGAPADYLGNCSDHNIVFDVTNPNKVYIVRSSLGLDVGYGVMEVASLVQENGFNGAGYASMVNNVIKFPAQSLVMALPSEGKWYYTNANGMTRIVMPGGVATDPQVTATYMGYMTDPDSNTSAIFDVKMNEDAGSFRWAVSNEITSDEQLNAFYAGILDGSVKYEEGTENGEYRYAMDEAGAFVALFVPYSADGTVTGNPALVQFEYTTGGVTPSQFAVEVQAEAGDTYVELNLIPNAKNFAYYWDFAPKSLYDQMVSQAGSIDAYMAAYFEQLASQYGITVADVLEVYASKGAVEEHFIDKLDPATEFVVFAYCVDSATGLSRSPITEYTFSTTTPADLAPAYEAWLGTWTVQPTEMEDGSPAAPFEIEVKLKQSNQMYYVTGWGLGTVLPTIPVTMVYQEDETGSLVYIPEQLLEEVNVGGDYPNACFMARFFYEQNQAYYLYGGGVPAILGVLTDAGAYMEPYQVEDEQLGLVEFSGADYFLMYSDGSFGAEIKTFAVGPYTLTRSASTANHSVQPEKIETLKMSQKKSGVNPVGEKAIRSIHNAKYNCVMVR